MEDEEISRLTTYLQAVFAENDLVVLQHPEDDDKALVAVGQAFFGKIDRDEDEGELSYSFSKDIPDAPLDELREEMRKTFNGQKIEIRRRKTGGSSEIYRGEEFLGVLYAEEGADGNSQVFNMAILDIDLDPNAIDDEA